MIQETKRACFNNEQQNKYKDPILKERLFGLTNPEGNHGEDVKELYYYLDNTPTHSYMKYPYKYPQAAFPYEQLLAGREKEADEFYKSLLTSVPISSVASVYVKIQ